MGVNAIVFLILIRVKNRGDGVKWHFSLFKSKARVTKKGWTEKTEKRKKRMTGQESFVSFCTPASFSMTALETSFTMRQKRKRCTPCVILSVLKGISSWDDGITLMMLEDHKNLEHDSWDGEKETVWQNYLTLQLEENIDVIQKTICVSISLSKYVSNCPVEDERDRVILKSRAVVSYCVDTRSLNK